MCMVIIIENEPADEDVCRKFVLQVSFKNFHLFLLAFL